MTYNNEHNVKGYQFTKSNSPEYRANHDAIFGKRIYDLEPTLKNRWRVWWHCLLRGHAFYREGPFVNGQLIVHKIGCETCREKKK